MVQIVNPLTIVNVGGGGTDIGIPREISQSGVYQVPSNLTTYALPAGVTDLGDYALAYAFIGCAGITSADFGSLTSITGKGPFFHTFELCSNLASIDFSSLATIESAAFTYAFMDCPSLTSIEFTSLSTLNSTTTSGAFQYAFMRCTSLASISFPALTANSFGTNTAQFRYMLSNCTGVTVHFPSSIQGQIASMEGYPSFGGTNTTVLFDL